MLAIGLDSMFVVAVAVAVVNLSFSVVVMVMVASPVGCVAGIVAVISPFSMVV